MKTFEIFRTGTHTTSKGETLSFGDADLGAIATGYDPEAHLAPIVVGHPKQDAPAYGWIKSLKVEGDRLVAEPDQLNPDFAELVRTGAFKKVSAAFYAPASAGNPTPGRYHLRHVGFLGAQPPAVKGLKPVEFDDGDAVVIEFSDSDLVFRNAWALESLTKLFRGLRDYFIETTDAETAEKFLPDWEIDDLARAAADMRAEGRAQETRPAFSETTTEDDTMDKTAEERQAALDAREAELNNRETAFAESERKRRADDDAAFVSGIVKDGRLPVGLQATATALFSELGDDDLTFSEGDETVETSPRAAFRDLLAKLPKPLMTGEFATGDGPDFSDPVYVASAIETEIAKAAEKGETLSPAQAAMRLTARN
ncbi:peptidase [Martelella mediterranea]|uniref:peptidase n=1 Tax=Martelella mediterranea TaxID=293089 RepID=UPI001E4C3517|nr:peptidase [Martelella mediterranea]MCD1634482.1 peptidase [Martelella mediterranea]